MTVRRTNRDRALLLLDWGMDKRRRGHEYTKPEFAAALGMGVGTNFDRIVSAARELCNERGWNLGYFHPCSDGKWRAAFTKTDAKLPLPGVAQRASAIAGQSTNVRKQVTFVLRHSGRDTVTQHAAKIVEQSEMALIEINSLLRVLVDQIADNDA